MRRRLTSRRQNRLKPPPSPSPSQRVPASKAAAPAPVPVAVPVPAAAAPTPVSSARPLDWTRHAYLIAGVAAVIWAGGLMAFVAGFQTHFGAFDYAPLHRAVLGLLAALPAIFMILTAFALRQGAQLAGETRRARAMADDLMLPAALAGEQVGNVAEAVPPRGRTRRPRRDRGPQQQLSGLRLALAEENDRLSTSRRRGRARRPRAGPEPRTGAQGDGRALDPSRNAGRAGVGEVIARQSRMVARSFRISPRSSSTRPRRCWPPGPRTWTRSRPARPSAPASRPRRSKLSRQTERLETASDTLSDRIARLHVSLASERDALERLAGDPCAPIRKTWPSRRKPSAPN